MHRKVLIAALLMALPAFAQQGEILGCDTQSPQYKQCMKEWDKQKGTAAKKAAKAQESQDFARRNAAQMEAQRAANQRLSDIAKQAAGVK